MSELPDRHLFIDGTWQDGADGEHFANVNPGTGAELCRVALARPADVDRAVAAAAAAQPAWGSRSGAERGRTLQRAAQLLRRDREAIARLESLDTGRPIAETPEADVDSAADCLEYFGSIAFGLTGEYIDLGGSFAYTRREPLGVCAGIGAWNYPLQIAAWKAAPALACGNAMVFKPAELTPITATKLAEALAEAGLPAGLFNVVQGYGDIGKALAEHEGVHKVSLTGEVGTGKKVMASAAGTLKNVGMELGGKSPMLVFGDAELDNAVGAALMGNFFSAGQVCTNGTRVFVERSVYEDFLERARRRTEAMRIGHPQDPETQMGSLISREHMESVLGYIEAGKREGARLVTGGRQVTEGACAYGSFVAPTIFADCSDDMTIVREEIFGPVMAVLPVDSEAEALRRANATPYGLAAGVFSSDLQRAHRVAAGLAAGIVWVNDYNLTPIEMPFGGVKQSGIGRENGHAALESYSQLKSVYVAMGDVDAAF